jgi:hypothetical protein
MSFILLYQANNFLKKVNAAYTGRYSHGNTTILTIQLFSCTEANKSINSEGERNESI